MKTKLKASGQSYGNQSHRSYDIPEVKDMTKQQTYDCFWFLQRLKMQDLGELSRQFDQGNLDLEQLEQQKQMLEMVWKDQVFIQFGVEIEDFDFAYRKYNLVEDERVQESLH